MPDSSGPLIFLIAGEHSGDRLGGALMGALRQALSGRVHFAGVGGEVMQAEGLASLYPLDEIAIMGPLAILRRLPQLVRRVYETVDAAIAVASDAVVIIDSPEFMHPIARRIRRRAPHIPIIDYVSPSVWAWRPGRSRRMRRYVDHILALLPFEPAVHERLGGPSCTYVGHPLIERRDWIRGLDPAPLARNLGLDKRLPVLVMLPGSRASEVSLLMPVFARALSRLGERLGPFEIILPTVAGVRTLVEGYVENWPQQVHLVAGEEDKFAALRMARAALAASGTVTLELALAGVPMAVAYRVERPAAFLRFMVKPPSIVLANLVLGENVFPEFIQEACTPDNLASALADLMQETPTRSLQKEALARIGECLALPEGTPSEAAARVVLSYLEAGAKRASS